MINATYENYVNKKRLHMKIKHLGWNQKEFFFYRNCLRDFELTNATSRETKSTKYSRQPNNIQWIKSNVVKNC